MPETKSASGSSLGCLARLFWMFLGVFALVISAILIAQKPWRRVSAGDVVFWAIAVALLCVRYADIKFLGGETATAQPASMRDWRRYAVLLTGVSVCLWVLAHGLAYLGFWSAE
jgi:hypothetical protein